MVTYNPTPNNNWNPTVTVTYPRIGGRISAPLTTPGIKIPKPVSENHLNYKGTTYEIVPGKVKRHEFKSHTPYYVEAPGTASHGKFFTSTWGWYGESVSGVVTDGEGKNKAARTLAVSKLRKLRQVKLPKPVATPVKFDAPWFPEGTKVVINKPNSVHNGWTGTVTDHRLTYSVNKMIHYVTFDNGEIRSYYHESLREAPSAQAVASLRALQKDIHETNIKNGFASITRSPGDLIALMHSELSEALEEYRKDTDVTKIYFERDKPTKPEGFMVELADCVIRILDCAESYGVDLLPVIEQKHAFNKTRSYRHGNKNL